MNDEEARTMRLHARARPEPRPAGSHAMSALARAAARVTSVLFVIALLLALVLGAVRLAFSWQPVYTYAVENYHADEVSGIPQAELLTATHSIRTYFTDSRRDLNITVRNDDGQLVPLFNGKEIAHMRDVKALVQRVYLLLDLAVAYLGVYVLVRLWLRRDAIGLARLVLRASSIVGLLLVAAAVASLFDFEQIFTEFHVLSFSNDFWQLDPAVDHLVQIFPQGFWLDVTLFVGLLALTGALILAMLSRVYLFLELRTQDAGRRTR
jgi:integral membrane protein (TIGR01906 family)